MSSTFYKSVLLLLTSLTFSLSTQAQSASDLEKRMDRLFTQVEINYFSYPDSSIYYANQLLELSRNNDQKKWMCAGYEGLGYGYFYKDKLPMALSMFEKQKALFKEMGDTVSMSLSYMNIANVNGAMGNYQVSIENFMAAQRLLPNTKEYHIDRAYLNYNLANTFLDFEDLDNAKVYLDRATTYARLDTVTDLYRSLNSIEAEVLISKGKYIEASTLLDSVLKDCERENDLVEEIYALNLSSRIALKEKDYARAEELQRKALHLAEVHGDPYAMLMSYVDMANVLLEAGRPREALEFARKANNGRKGQRSLVAHKESAHVYARALEATGRPGKALGFYKEFMAYSDSLKKVNINESILQSENELIEQSNKLLAEKSGLQGLVIKRNNLLMGVMGLALLICAVAMVITTINVRKRKKGALLLQEKQAMLDQKTRELAELNENLEMLNKGKDKLLSIMTHDIKQPFNQTLGALEIMALQNTDKDLNHLLEEVKRSVENDKKTVENLLIWSKSQFAKISARPMPVHPYHIASELKKEMKQSLNEKGLSLSINIDESATVMADPNHLEIILRNLLTNAIKFSHTGGQLELSSTNLGEKVEIAVSDQGVGMSPEQLKSLFDLKSHFSEKGTLNEAGTGLGMLIVFDFVKENKGEIKVESAPAQGSVFRIQLPAA